MNGKQVENYTKSDKAKILLSPLQDDGCSWYRLKTFMDCANAMGLAKVETFDPNLSVSEITEVLKATDAFVFRFYSEAVVEVVSQFKKNFPKVPVIMDTDDDIYTISPFNNSYDKFGTQEVKLKDGTYLWKYSPHFDMYVNRHRLVDYEYCLEQSDAVITTTLRLADRIKENNPAVAVIPNSIDPQYWPVLDIKKTDEIRLVWSGGSSHYEDLEEIKPGLDILIKKYPQLKLVIVGSNFGSLVKGIPEDRYEFWKWIKADGHGYRMACTNADIAIAPLRDMEFNRYKSNIKWYEYSALKIPTVAVNLPPYSDEIEHGVTGLLYSGNDEFVKYISLLIDDPLKRFEIANNAYKWVKENRFIDKTTREWINFITNLIKAKRESIAQVIKPMITEPERHTYDEVWCYYSERAEELMKGKKSILKMDAYNEAERIPIIKDKGTVIEYNQDIIDKALKINPSLHAVRGDIRNLPFKSGEFDLLIDLSTLDHIKPQDLASTIKGYARVLEKNGTLLLIVWLSDLVIGGKWDPDQQYYFKYEEIKPILEKYFTIESEKCIFSRQDRFTDCYLYEFLCTK